MAPDFYIINCKLNTFLFGHKINNRYLKKECGLSNAQPVPTNPNCIKINLFPIIFIFEQSIIIDA